MSNRQQIFKTLDHPPRILFWKIDEFAVMVIPIFLAIALGNLLIALAVFLKIPYSRFKRSFSHRSLQHYLYWYLPTAYMKHLKSMPSSHERTLIL